MEPDQASTKKGPACPSCGGRLRLRADQIGTQVTCPKCGSTFAVGRPGQATSKSTSDDDAYEPEIPLKRSSIVPEEELSGAIPASHHNEYDVDWGSAVPEREPPHVRPLDLQTDYLEVAKAKGLLRMEYMPDPPRWTFFSGVFLSPW